MKKRKAQITVFIIVGVIIIASVSGAVYIGKAKIESDLSEKYFSQEGIKPQLNNIQESILNCIDITTEDSLIIIGIQGGYYNEPSEFFDLGWAFIPYYYNQGAFLMPSKEKISTELRDYVNENLKYCIDEINIGDFTLDYNTPKTSVNIKDASVLFKIDSSITIEREGNKIKFETKKHPIEQASKLSEIIEIASYITNSHKEDPDMICINCVAEMARERDVYVDMLDFDETTTQIIISENKSSEEPYIFEFLNKYTVE